jgi:hypothetical protein
VQNQAGFIPMMREKIYKTVNKPKENGAHNDSTKNASKISSFSG